MHACKVQVLVASGENMSRANSMNGANNNIADAAGIVHIAPTVQNYAVSIGNASSTSLLVLVSPAQAMVVMMDSMRMLQEHMLSIASALSNPVNVSM